MVIKRKISTDKKNKTNWEKLKVIISGIAIIISLIALFFSIRDYLPIGDIKPIKPTCYAIIRGTRHFPSDHIVFPIEWINTYGLSKTIRNIELIFLECDQEGNIIDKKGNIIFNKEDIITNIVINREGINININKKNIIIDKEGNIIDKNKNIINTMEYYHFLLAGEYKEISDESFNKDYIFNTSFIIKARNVTARILCFHNEEWWDSDENNKLYNFQFKSGKYYNVFLNYQVNVKKERDSKLIIKAMPIYKSIDKLMIDRNTSQWDLWYLYTKKLITPINDKSRKKNKINEVNIIKRGDYLLMFISILLGFALHEIIKIIKLIIKSKFILRNIIPPFFLTISTFFLIIEYWWDSYNDRNIANISICWFILILLQPIMYYLIATLLRPKVNTKIKSFNDSFYQNFLDNKKIIYSLGVFLFFIVILITIENDGFDIKKTNDIIINLFRLVAIVLCILGIKFKNYKGQCVVTISLSVILILFYFLIIINVIYFGTSIN